MADFVNKIFTDQVVNLDGNSFENCTFDGCVIHYAGGTVRIEGGLQFLSENRIQFDGAALNTWKVMSFLSKGMGIPLGSLYPLPD